MTDERRIITAEGWLELGDWFSANAELEEMEPQSRTHPMALALRVRIYAAAGRWQEAIWIGQNLESLKNVEMLVALARSACQLGKLEDARRWASQAIALRPTGEFKLQMLDDSLLARIWPTGN